MLVRGTLFYTLELLPHSQVQITFYEAIVFK